VENPLYVPLEGIMCYIRETGIAIVLLTAVAVAICASPSHATLAVASDSQLAQTLGAGCTGPKGNNNFCNGPDFCTPQGATGSVLNTGTTTIKAWCDSTSVGAKTCDCNQNGIPQSTCRNLQTCTDRNCKTCGAKSPYQTVQSTVNQNGKPCTQDADCTGS